MIYAFLGAGKMGGALIHGMLRARLCTADEIVVADHFREGLDELVAATSVTGAKNNAEAVAKADVVVLAVKPADVEKALQDAAGKWPDKLLVSVATGISLANLQQAAPGSRVVRVMPNTAAMVGFSATAIAYGDEVTAADRDVVEKIFASVGEVYGVTESQLDAVTGLSGSGPAYMYLMLEALSDGGVACGLPRKLALQLAVQTMRGAAEMVASTGENPAVLREMVTSPGGTTIAALGVLEQRATRSAVSQAVQAAAHRSRELAGD